MGPLDCEVVLAVVLLETLLTIVLLETLFAAVLLEFLFGVMVIVIVVVDFTVIGLDFARYLIYMIERIIMFILILLISKLVGLTNILQRIINRKLSSSLYRLIITTLYIGLIHINI